MYRFVKYFKLSRTNLGHIDHSSILWQKMNQKNTH